jgi:hypothetical protein
MFEWIRGKARIEQVVIDKIFELYVLQNKKYLRQNPKDYATLESRNDNKEKPLMSYMLKNHLEQKATYGVFAGKYYTKFLCFDVDYADNSELSKWVTYKLTRTLSELGLGEYHVSFSGRKGYHIDIFIEDLIDIKTAQEFHKLVLERSEIPTIDKGQVEYRPTFKQGVKLPLGIHQKSEKFCGYCDIDDGLNVLSVKDSIDYLFQIRKVKKQAILDILERELDLSEYGKGYSFPKETPKKEDILVTENAIAQHKNLPIYEPTEDSKIDNAIELLNQGFKVQGSRHNSIMNIALYLKYLGNEKVDTLEQLYKWMAWQDSRLYNSSVAECHRDIYEVVEWVYEKDCSIQAKKKEATVTLPEINAIITQCPQKNQKLIMYALLVHSKFFPSKDGVFYMTFEQISKATGLAKNTVCLQVNKLGDLGVLEFVERNRVQNGTYRKAPNLYRITLDVQQCDVELEYQTEKQNDFVHCLKVLYTEIQLRKLIPRRQFADLLVA